MRPWLCILSVSLALFVETVPAQSLSLVKRSAGDYWVHASVPDDAHYILQGSANLRLWVNLYDEVRGMVLYGFDPAGVSKRFFRLVPWTPPPAPILVVLLGDSTVADGSGWGQGIYRYFRSNAQVVNLAQPWHSTKWFLGSDEKRTLLTLKPDVVLAQFGLTDSEMPVEEYRTTLPEYAENLRTIVGLIRGFGGTPVLVTPSANRWWDEDGEVMPWMPDRAAVMKEVAAEVQADLIDLNRLTMDLYTKLGPHGCDFMHWVEPDDGIHFSVAGAEVVAGLVVNALPERWGGYLQGILGLDP